MADYLERTLAFFPDRIEVEGSGEQVMMAWEAPLMRRMAEIACIRRGDVLEIGFGMGLSSNAVSALRPKSHTIVEAHPQILERARAWAAGRPDTRIVAGRWQDVLAQLDRYDGISFDVYGGGEQRLAFVRQLRALLRPGGCATMWLGDAKDLPADLGQLLAEQDFVYRMVRVAAVPDRRCTYSASNEFWLPIITANGATSSRSL